MKLNQQGEINQIISDLAATNGPVGIEILIRSFDSQISKPTLLRRLEVLIRIGLVQRTGKARATRYSLTPEGRAAIPDSAQAHSSASAGPRNPTERAQEQVLVPVQPEADLKPRVHYMPPANFSARFREPGVDDPPVHELPEEDPADVEEREHLRALLRRPLSQRARVDYRRDFLEAYEPNVTFYLPEPLRGELRRAGQSDGMARLPAGTYVRSVMNRVLIDLSWNSSRLEGNTFSLLETDRLLALGHSEDPARMMEARMILNHKDAIEFLVDEGGETGFNRYTILNLHGMLSHQLLAETRDEGRLRRIAVGIGGCAYQPLDIPQVIEECFLRILDKAAAIRDPLEASFFCMVHLPYLQPFVDVNKRVSRLAANIPLIRENLAPLTFVDMPVRDYTEAILAVYELNRVELLRDVFAKAYRSSAGKYSEVRQGLRAPDALHLKWNEELRGVARAVVQAGMGKSAAAEHIRQWSIANVPIADRPRVVEMAEGILLALHEGNFARYRLRPSEFDTWQARWET